MCKHRLFTLTDLPRIVFFRAQVWVIRQAVSYRAAVSMTHLTLQSADIVHSFWQPQLNAETDLITQQSEIETS